MRKPSHHSLAISLIALAAALFMIGSAMCSCDFKLAPRSPYSYWGHHNTKKEMQQFCKDSTKTKL